MDYSMYTNNLNENNCNCRLTDLYKQRDSISQRIDKLISLGYDTEAAEQEYDNICRVILKLSTFRRSHKCLLEGDPGYGFN